MSSKIQKNNSKLVSSLEKQDIIFKNKDENNAIKLDSILDKKLVKFDNKLQMSMFFIAYKSINALYKELYESVQYTIPDEIIKRVVLENVPSLIKEYNSNLRKRCRVNGNAASNINELDDTICLGRKIDGTQCTRKKYNNNDFCKNHIKKLCNGRVDIPLGESINEPIINKKEHAVNVIFKETTLENEKAKANAKANANAKGMEPEIETETETEMEKEPEKKTDKTTLEIGIDNCEPCSTKPIKASKRGRKSKIQFDPRQYDNEYITLWEDIVEGEKVLIDNSNNIYTYDLEHPVYIGKKDVTVKLGIRQIIDSLVHTK